MYCFRLVGFYVVRLGLKPATPFYCRLPIWPASGLDNRYMQVTCRLHAGYMQATCKLHARCIQGTHGSQRRNIAGFSLFWYPTTGLSLPFWHKCRNLIILTIPFFRRGYTCQRRKWNYTYSQAPAGCLHKVVKSHCVGWSVSSVARFTASYVHFLLGDLENWKLRIAQWTFTWHCEKLLNRRVIIFLLPGKLKIR